MPDDPRRAEHITQNRLDNAQLASDVRSIGAQTGTLNGVPVTVTASGMGAPSVSIYATESFLRHGMRRICRVGTCGALSPRMHIRDVVIVSATHTDFSVATVAVSGVTLSLAPILDILAVVATQARQDSDRVTHVGSIFTGDYFYYPRTDITPELSKLGTLAAGVEAAGLYAAAARNNAEALVMLTISDHTLNHSADLTTTGHEIMFEDVLEIAVAALLARE